MHIEQIFKQKTDEPHNVRYCFTINTTTNLLSVGCKLSSIFWSSQKATHELSGVRGFGGTTGGRTNLAPGRRACPVLAGSGGGSDGVRRWPWVRVKPGSDGFRMCTLPRTGGGGGGAFFLIDELVTPAVLAGGGIGCDSTEWLDAAET